jgi:transposase
MKKITTLIPSCGEPNFAAFVAIDWADELHAFSLCPAGSGRVESGTVRQDPQSLHQWLAELGQRFGGQPVAVAVELTRGPLVWALHEHPFVTIYPVTPVTSAKLRQGLYPAGAKSDPADSRLLLMILQHHRDRLRPLRWDETQTRLLGQLAADRRHAVEQRTALVEQLTAALKEYFPLALEVAGKLTQDVACRFLEKWPSLEELQAATPHRIRKFFYGQNCRADLEPRLQQIKAACALTGDPAVLEPGRRKVQLLAQMIVLLNEHIRQYEDRIAPLYREHPDRGIFESLPGAGAALGPRLLTAFGMDRGRFAAALNLANYSGIAPVQKSSGKSRLCFKRLAFPPFLHQTLFEFAGKSVGFSVWARNYYQAQRKKGRAHNTILRALAFKWTRVLWRCWQDSRPYDEQVYLAALQRAGSPYAAQN